MAAISGVTREDGVPVQSVVSLYDASTQALVETKTTDVNGAYDFIGLADTTEYMVMRTQIVGEIWDSEVAVVIDDILRTPDFNGFLYVVIQNGTTGVAPPKWSLIMDEEFADGTVLMKAYAHTLRPSVLGPIFPNAGGA